MNKKYGYRNKDIIFPYGLLLILPLIIIYVILDFTLKHFETVDVAEFRIALFISALFAIIFLAVLLWIVNNIKTVITLNDIGIIKKDMFRKVVIKWSEITKIDKKYLYEGSYSRYQNEPPSDLLIYGDDSKKIQVYKILQNLDGNGEGIVEFEKEMYKLVIFNNKYDIKKYERNQLLLGIAGGFLVIIAAIITSYSHPHYVNMLLGPISRWLGFYGAVALMILSGCFIVGFFAYRLKPII